jgi:hypothetical protein
MKQYPDHDLYKHIKLVRMSFFVMAVLLMISLFFQFLTEHDYKGMPFLLFGIGVTLSFSTLIIRVIIRWVLRLR